MRRNISTHPCAHSAHRPVSSVLTGTSIVAGSGKGTTLSGFRLLRTLTKAAFHETHLRGADRRLVQVMVALRMMAS